MAPQVSSTPSGRRGAVGVAPKESSNSAAGDFLAGQEMASAYERGVDDYSKFKQLVEARLSSLQNEEQRSMFMEGLIRALSTEHFSIKWRLAEDFVKPFGPRTELLAAAIRDAAKVDPSWAFEKLRSYDDPVVSEAALQGVIKAITPAGSPLTAIEIIKSELGDSEFFSQALYHWLSELKDQPGAAVPQDLAKEFLTDPRVDAKMKEKFADMYIRSANDISPMEAARLLNREKVMDGGWGPIVAAGAKLTGAEANEFIGLVFNASKYQVADFMTEYMKSTTPKDVFNGVDSYPDNARQTMLCATAPYVIGDNLISEFLSKVDRLGQADRDKTIERVVDYCGRNHIPREQIEPLFQYGAGNPKLEKIYNHYLPKE